MSFLPSVQKLIHCGSPISSMLKFTPLPPSFCPFFFKPSPQHRLLPEKHRDGDEEDKILAWKGCEPSDLALTPPLFFLRPVGLPYTTRIHCSARCLPGDQCSASICFAPIPLLLLILWLHLSVLCRLLFQLPVITQFRLKRKRIKRKKERLKRERTMLAC